MNVFGVSMAAAYFLLFFLAVAAWTLKSTALLAVVVLGVVGVALGIAWISSVNNKNAKQGKPPLV